MYINKKQIIKWVYLIVIQLFIVVFVEHFIKEHDQSDEQATRLLY